LQTVEHQHNCQGGTNTEVADGYLDPLWRHPAAPHRRPLSQQRIVDTALALFTAKGSTRRVTQVLDTGPASQYAHLRNKEVLYQLFLDQLIGEVTMPEPVPTRGREHSSSDSMCSWPGWERLSDPR
jgi:hypothetical protein